MRKLWLIGILIFLGLLFWQIWAKEPDFYYSAHDYFQQAQEALLGDNARALTGAEKAYQKDPQNWDYADFLAWRYLEAKRPQEALDLFRQVWAARPTVSALKGQALALEQQGQRTEALQLLDSYLATYPEDAVILRMAAVLAGRENAQQPKALAYYQRLAALNPQDQESRRQVINLLTALGRFGEAIPLQEQLVADNPEDPQMLHQLALLHAWRQDHQAAAAIYLHLLDREADNQALRLEAAKNAEAAGRPDQALAHYLRLYAQTNGQKDYALILARLWSQKGDHAEAAAVLSPLMNQNPSLEERRWYALELLLAKDFGHSLQAYRRAWEAGDSHKETIVNLARLLAQKQQFHQAANFWDEAGRRQLLDGDLRREAALTYAYARRHRDAVAVLQPVDRNDPKLLLFLGQQHFYQQHWSQAAHYYQRYLQLQPRDVAVRQQLAQVLSFMPQNLEAAAQQYDEAGKLSSHPGLQLQKAATLLQLAQDVSDDPTRRDQAPARWAAAATALRQVPVDGLPPALLLEQGRLFLWLGDLEAALDRFEKYLTREPRDRRAHLDKAQVLIYLQRGAEATEVLRRLPPALDRYSPLTHSQRAERASPARLADQPETAWSKGGLIGEGTRAAEDGGPGSAPARSDEVINPIPSDNGETGNYVPAGGRPPTQAEAGKLTGPASRPSRSLDENRSELEVPLLFLEAALAERRWPEAHRRAWQLYLLQVPGDVPPPPTWTAARRRLHEAGVKNQLTPEARVAIARALCQHPHLESEPDLVRTAVDLCLTNLQSRRPGGPDDRRCRQASLLLLSYLLPRLSHFDDLQDVNRQIPGIRSQSPEYIAALQYFSGNLGRQGGKLQYLLQTLKDRQESYPSRRPGDLIFLASLASELGDPRLAGRYFDQALRLRPLDQRLAALRLQALAAAQDPGRLLKALEEQPQTPETALALAQTYLQRGQYEGTLAVLEAVPAAHPAWERAQMLRLQAHRSLQDYPGALATLRELQDRGHAGAPVLMARAQVLEALDDKAGAQAAYEVVIAQAPDAVTAQTAKARLARFRGDWAGANRHFVAALKENPQDIELLNELEQVREQLRPALGARNLAVTWRGERRPEEAWRPWQFGRFDREPGGGAGLRTSPRAALPVQLPYALIPETTLMEDHNRIKALETRLAGGFWLGRTLPVYLALGYRVYQQQTTGPGPANLDLGLNPVFGQSSQNRTTWERAEATLTLGPLVLGDRLKVTGELSGRRYWKKLAQQVTQAGQTFIPFPPVLLDTVAGARVDDRETRNRLLGSFAIEFAPRAPTNLTLRYSRRDIFDQDPGIYPRLYQQVNRLDTLPLITLDQAELSAAHQFFPGLSYQGALSQAFFSDGNQRFSLFQALRWQAMATPRRHLDIVPSYYLALYRRSNPSYFSPHAYHALGVTLDFDQQLAELPLLRSLSQLFSRLLGSDQHSGLTPDEFLSPFAGVPTVVLQTTAQVVNNDGLWGPAVSTLVGLETEPIQNLYVGLHYFYFREWAANYWFNSLIFGMKWRF